MQPISALLDVDVPFSSGSSSSSSQPGSSLSEAWQWMTDFLDEAKIPTLGLPVRFEASSKKRQLIAFNPESLTCIDIDSYSLKKLKRSPIGFIESTKGHFPMPGTETPASARFSRYMEPRFNDHLVSGSREETLAPCLACGDYVCVESLQLDHAQAKEEIQRRQQAFVERLNQDAALASFLLSFPGMDKFFVRVNDQYYGTVFFYEVYFNDMDNLWLICSACNLHKSDQEVISWFQEQWLYGDEFLDYLGKLKTNSPILLKTQYRQGLAEAAMDWYWDRHANYASISKRLMQNIVTPIRILNQRVDRVVGLVRAGGDERRLQRHAASLDFRMALLSEIATMKGIDMPPRDSESSNSSSDESAYLKDSTGSQCPVDLPVYRESTEEIVKESAERLRTILVEKAKEKMSKKQSESVQYK